MAFKDAIKSLKDAIGDLSSLEVQTLTGELSSEVFVTDAGGAGSKPHSGGSVLDWSKAISSAKKTEGKVSLVLATIINFDGDATLFARSGEIPSHMLEAHKAAVEAGIKVRSEIANLVITTTKGFLD